MIAWPRSHALPPLLLALTWAGCAAPLSDLRRQSEQTNQVGGFKLEYPEGDERSLQKVQAAIQAAGQPLSRWGMLRDPITVEVLPSHPALEKAVGRSGYGWLRAWARYEEVFVQSPGTWGFIGPTQGEVTELMVHELTHCMMYQQSSDRLDWSSKEFPLWFREGMASFTAHQGYRWPTQEDLARFLDAHPPMDLINRPELIYRTESDFVYSAAHHAFAFLVQRYGELRVRQTLMAMRAGLTFPQAFSKVIGISAADFAADFKRYVRWRGFRTARVQPQ